MLVVETIAKIRRAYSSLGKPIKEICRDLHVSRKVVRKVLRSEATEFRYTRETQSLPKIGPWRDAIDALLLANEGKAPRERLTLIRVFEVLGARSTTAQLRFDRFWRNARTHTLHDPIDYKLQELGDWRLNGAIPKPSFYS